MNAIPVWTDACAAFGDFLEAQGHPAQVRWVFRDDIYEQTVDRVIAPRRQRLDRAELAAKVFADGRSKGLVEITGLASTDRLTLATVWYPKFPGEEVQGWNQGMKLTVRTPLSHASLVSSTMWVLVKLLPTFRRYQSSVGFVATTRWAAA